MIADLTINGNPDGCATLNDCAMIQDYKDSTKAL